jgi:hypothetical protein
MIVIATYKGSDGYGYERGINYSIRVEQNTVHRHTDGFLHGQPDGNINYNSVEEFLKDWNI